MNLIIFMLTFTYFTNFIYQVAKYFLVWFLIGMIYSLLKQKEIPVLITKEIQSIDDNTRDITIYNVYDNQTGRYIGNVDLEDTKNGVKVLYINNKQEKLYKHFSYLADQIEVEHCLKRGIDNPYIQSVAARNTYIQHFLRGKRFINEGINIYLDYLTKNLVNGEKIFTDFLGYQKMYMPINIINQIKDKIKINPLLKNL